MRKISPRQLCIAMLGSVVAFAWLPTGLGSQSATSSILADERVTDPEACLELLGDETATIDVIVALQAEASLPRVERPEDQATAAALRLAVSRQLDDFFAALTPDASRLRVGDRFENFAGFSCRVTAAGLRDLLARPEVSSIEPDREVEIATLQGVDVMHAGPALSVYDGSGTSIAIVDTGVDYQHEALGNGGFPNAKVVGGWDFGDDDADPMDLQGHGTAVAGIAAGEDAANCSISYRGGVAGAAKIYALKVVTGGGTSTTHAKIAAAWDWCVTHKFDDVTNPIVAVTTSFAGNSPIMTACDGSFPALSQAASNCRLAQIAVFAGAGNAGFCDAISTPACVTDAYAIGAVYDQDGIGPLGFCSLAESSCRIDLQSDCTVPPDGIDENVCIDTIVNRDAVTCYSNSNAQVWLLAPSEQANCPQLGGGCDSFGGTSAATPYAAGAYAVYQDAFKRTLGSFQDSGFAVLTMIVSGDVLVDPKSGISTPRINLANAMATFGPGNDECMDARPLDDRVPTAFSNRGATSDGYVEPFECDTGDFDADVWFTFTPALSGPVSVSTCGSQFDTKVAVYVGCPTGDAQAIRCDDNTCGLQSLLEFAGTAGTTYWIRVAGAGGQLGDGTITASGPCPPPDYPRRVEASDGDFCDSIRVTWNPVVGATEYRVFRDSVAIGDWVPINFYVDDDAATETTHTYTVKARNMCGDVSTGSVADTGHRCWNDDCEDAILITEGIWDFTTLGARTDGEYLPSYCSQFKNDDARADIWFTYFPGIDGECRVRLCNSDFDTVLAIYEGDRCLPGPFPIACDDDGCTYPTSEVSFLTKVGTTYLIRVGGYLSAEGQGTMEVTFDRHRVATCSGIDNERVLRINDTGSHPLAPIVSATMSSLIEFSIEKPDAGGNGKFVVHMNPRIPTDTTIAPLPAGLGDACFPLLLPQGASPVAIWTTINKPNQIGTSNLFGDPIPDPDRAPTTFFSSFAHDIPGFSQFTRWTIQAVIVNPDASSPKGVSVTNAVILDLLP